jgi:hypothetical protein
VQPIRIRPPPIRSSRGSHPSVPNRAAPEPIAPCPGPRPELNVIVKSLDGKIACVISNVDSKVSI